MINKKFGESIKIISEVLNQNNIRWALIGSTNMAVQGMDISPRDLDIVVQIKDLEKVRLMFLKYNPSEIKELKPLVKGSAWEVKLTVNDIEVQVLGEEDSGEYVKKLLANQLIIKKLNDVTIPCFTLEAEAKTYADTKRQHKSDLINNFLKSKTK